MKETIFNECKGSFAYFLENDDTTIRGSHALRILTQTEYKNPIFLRFWSCKEYDKKG